MSGDSKGHHGNERVELIRRASTAFRSKVAACDRARRVTLDGKGGEVSSPHAFFGVAFWPFGEWRDSTLSANAASKKGVCHDEATRPCRIHRLTGCVPAGSFDRISSSRGDSRLTEEIDIVAEKWFTALSQRGDCDRRSIRSKIRRRAGIVVHERSHTPGHCGTPSRLTRTSSRDASHA